MIFRPFTLLCLVAFLGAGLHVYQTKHAAALLDRELRSIARKVEDAEARTQTLQAEWAWLNEPERLRSVAQRHLPELEAMQPAQFQRAAEAERRLPAAVAYAGPTALFATREPTTPTGNTILALLPRLADPVQVAVIVPPSHPAPAVRAAQVLPPAPPPQTPAPATEAAPAIAAAPPPVPARDTVVAVALPAAPTPRLPEPRSSEARAPEPAPRPLPVEPVRAAPPRPASRPMVRPATEVATLPPVAAPPARAAITQVAAGPAARPASEPSRGVLALGGSALGGSALGSSALGSTGRAPLLPPPVPFGSAGAATLGATPWGAAAPGGGAR